MPSFNSISPSEVQNHIERRKIMESAWASADSEARVQDTQHWDSGDAGIQSESAKQFRAHAGTADVCRDQY